MGDTGSLMDLDMESNEFFQIMAKPPALPNQGKSSQEDTNEEKHLNISTP